MNYSQKSTSKDIISFFLSLNKTIPVTTTSIAINIGLKYMYKIVAEIICIKMIVVISILHLINRNHSN